MSSRTEYAPQPAKRTDETEAALKDLKDSEFSDALSANGTTYRVGVKVLAPAESDGVNTNTQVESKTQSSDPSIALMAHGADNWIAVDWPVEGIRVSAPQDFCNQTNVRFYILVYDSHQWIYSYELRVATNKPGTYMFKDVEGDIYILSVTGVTYVLGENAVNVFNYNSKKPEIKAACYRPF
ncbi:hypothetical protein FA15DRAFT_716431 [Coprinopsis marcescibilis]|uniref:Uncharacterized protein n=1 Tax=Coprinopsis marcescibilis TaxID=230819 RepID=A0A5C3KNV9_COPMA|nr:hypothetical protein FA15DRAFT_716431 [Coprinopsis marcescibilis]